MSITAKADTLDFKLQNMELADDDDQMMPEKFLSFIVIDRFLLAEVYLIC